jgi:rod shape determining protein RodA
MKKNNIKNIFRIPLLIIIIISSLSILILYSINELSFCPWGFRQLIRLFIGIVFLIASSLVPITFWKKYAYYFYFIGILFLVVVMFLGRANMGAQRWINIYSFSFQPSELMRIFLIISLAKYFSTKTVKEVEYTVHLIYPLLLVILPMVLVLLQPDLGTAMIIFFSAVAMFFVAGVGIWKFVIAFCASIIALPIVWNMLYDYQKNRLLMFIFPESDPSGAGYHIIQSKIALGSGGIFGKGFANGTQCSLNFLPEKQTDFVFSAFGEEFGFIGCMILIILYLFLMVYNFSVYTKLRDRFSQLMVFGLSTMFFLYVFINISMVCGLLPVVGIPLPFFSYGGSALVVLMFCQGIIFSSSLKAT